MLGDPLKDAPSSLSLLYPNTRRVTVNEEEEVEQSGIPELEAGVSKMQLGIGQGGDTSKGHQEHTPTFLKHYHGTLQIFLRLAVSFRDFSLGIGRVHRSLPDCKNWASHVCSVSSSPKKKDAHRHSYSLQVEHRRLATTFGPKSRAEVVKLAPTWLILVNGSTHERNFGRMPR